MKALRVYSVASQSDGAAVDVGNQEEERSWLSNVDETRGDCFRVSVKRKLAKMLTHFSYRCRYYETSRVHRCHGWHSCPLTPPPGAPHRPQLLSQPFLTHQNSRHCAAAIEGCPPPPSIHLPG